LRGYHVTEYSQKQMLRIMKGQIFRMFYIIWRWKALMFN